MPVQGTEADLMKLAMIAVDEKLGDKVLHFATTGKHYPDESKSTSGKAVDASSPHSTESLGQQILQIHDSILIECPEENAHTVSAILKDTMESIAPDLGIKLKVDVSIGKNWGEV